MTTAVAPALTFQSDARSGWTSNGNGHGAMNSEDVGRMFGSVPRKTAQRQNSSSSLASTSSSTSTISLSSAQMNGVNGAAPEVNTWATRKKPSRGLWPSGKAEAATGISTARPQVVNSATSGPTASSAISALHAPALPSQVPASATGQTNTGLRNNPPPEVPAILHLLPMNGTFERKTITVPYYPDVLRVGRQTNQKTIPTPLNGYFDSKVLSRQHAEIWADRQGRVFIRDVKSSNGTFVNGMRLSQENKESEPRELREQDVLELGIDIVSEDQKTVVHHKVAAKVEHAGVYSQGNDALSFGDLDAGNIGTSLSNPHPLKRSSSQGTLNGRMPASAAVMNQQAIGMGLMNQPSHMRNWLNPITAEHIVKRLNTEMKMALQQSQDLARARQTIEQILGSKVDAPPKDSRNGSDRLRPSPIKSKADLKAHFSEPPAPPPQAPLPEKPDGARSLADSLQPLLRRSDTARPISLNSSPTRNDHTGDVLRLYEELKLARGELSNQNERMRTLEHELAQERTARESAEERAQKFEMRDYHDPQDIPTTPPTDELLKSSPKKGRPDMQAQLERLQASMDEMKQQMEAYRRRAELAESERDEARQSLAQLVEEKRRENAERKIPRTPPKTPKSPSQRSPRTEGKSISNGHAVSPQSEPPTSTTLLERAGIERDQPITPDQAKLITQLLTQEVLQTQQHANEPDGRSQYARASYGSAAAVIILGMLVMTWANGLPKVDRALIGLP